MLLRRSFPTGSRTGDFSCPIPKAISLGDRRIGWNKQIILRLETLLAAKNDCSMDHHFLIDSTKMLQETSIKG